MNKDATYQDLVLGALLHDVGRIIVEILFSYRKLYKHRKSPKTPNQKTEGRRQKTEDRKQISEFRLLTSDFCQ